LIIEKQLEEIFINNEPEPPAERKIDNQTPPTEE